jgi:hypothetical protein
MPLAKKLDGVFITKLWGEMMIEGNVQNDLTTPSDLSHYQLSKVNS